LSNQLNVHKVQARGIYKEGQVHLLEPVDISGPCPVSVVFETELADLEREVPQTAAALEGIVGLLNDLTSEQRRLFDEAMQRRGPFFGERLVELEDWMTEN
jgi:hypothetical protein